MSKSTESKAYNKFKIRISSTDKDKILDTIKKYYELAEDYISEEMKMKTYTYLSDQSIEDLKSVCLELCGEAINRDMIQYLLKGIRGTIGPELYKILK